MEKVRYEIDPHNRLVLEGSGRKKGLPRFRKVMDGQFKTDENNNLYYHVKAPLSEGENIPHQIRIKGEWSLTDSHDLRLTLDKSGRRTFGDRITLQGEILDVDKNSILFAIMTTKNGAKSVYTLNLDGSWKADENNRLSFHVKKEKGAHDILTLNGAWQIGRNHQITYQYEKAELIRKKRKTHTLIFKGYWDIKKKLRISYVLGKGTDSVFDFRVGAGVFKEGRIRYEIGMGLAGRTDPTMRTVTLYGKWNLKKGVGLVFEMAYADKKTREIAFGADASLTDKDTVSFRLRNGVDGRDMDVTLELSRKILKGRGEAFLRLLGSRQESAIYAGAAWRW